MRLDPGHSHQKKFLIAPNGSDISASGVCALRLIINVAAGNYKARNYAIVSLR